MLSPPDTATFLQLEGNPPDESEREEFILHSEDVKSGWFAVLRYQDSGHVSDREPIDSDGLLRAM